MGQNACLEIPVLDKQRGAKRVLPFFAQFLVRKFPYSNNVFWSDVLADRCLFHYH